MQRDGGGCLGPMDTKPFWLETSKVALMSSLCHNLPSKVGWKWSFTSNKQNMEKVVVEEGVTFQTVTSILGAISPYLLGSPHGRPMMWGAKPLKPHRWPSPSPTPPHPQMRPQPQLSFRQQLHERHGVRRTQQRHTWVLIQRGDRLLLF